MMKSIISIFLLLVCASAFSHEGRAYLIYEHKKVAKNEVSVRVDPDTGKGTIEVFATGDPVEPMIIELEARASGSALLKAIAMLDSEESTPPGRLVYKAILPFDHAGLWNLQIQFKQNEELVYTSQNAIEVVEPGPNKKEFILFILPFSLIGFLIWKVNKAKRKSVIRKA